MSKSHSGRVDLREVFLHVQEQMLANLSSSRVFGHSTSCGAATEQHWIELFNRYLPQRYQATSAFIVDADGNRSRQIDIAVHDRFYSPLLFHHKSEPHIPAESVYAVFEVKQTISAACIADAGMKAASVRRLRRTSAQILSAGSVYSPKTPPRILAGILGYDTTWAKSFEPHMRRLLGRLEGDERLDLGCCLRHGAFEGEKFSGKDEALIYLMLGLVERLQGMGASAAIDWSEYRRVLRPQKAGGLPNRAAEP